MPIAQNIPKCHHVRTDGIRCGSPSMRGRNHCFYHLRTTAIPPSRPKDMPNLEDGLAIQHGIAQVIRRLLCYDLDYKAAYCLLHAYKLALWNLKNCRLPDAFWDQVVTADPASDPENAGDATEPTCHRDIHEQLEAKYKAAHPEEFQQEGDPYLSENFAKFVARELRDPEEPNAGAPPARFSQVGSESRTIMNDRAPSLSPSVGDRMGAKLVDETVFGKRETGNGQPDVREKPETKNEKLASSPQDDTYLAQDVSPGKASSTSESGFSRTAPPLDKRPIQRIVVPKEISDAINSDPNQISDEELMKLAAAMFNIKTG
jgi:hypothetical protein